MSSIITLFENFLVTWGKSVPLEVFTFVGSFVEEVIAPIPSPLIMITAGSIAQIQGRPLIYLIPISIIGALGKTIGASLLYFISDKLEDVITTKFGKFVGITHSQVEALGSHFKGNFRDLLILFSIRSLPIIPSAPISLVCGIIKIPFKIFVSATFVGSILRDALFIYFGYSGLSALNSVIHGVEATESLAQIVVFLGLGSIIAWAYFRRFKNSKKQTS